MKRIAIIVPEYTNTLTEGGESHAMMVGDLLAKNFAVSILTTGRSANQPNPDPSKGKYTIMRFKTKKNDARKFNQLYFELLSQIGHPLIKELDWMRSGINYSPNLIEYIKINRTKFDVFIFIGYSNPLTFFGLQVVKKKSVLIPLVHHEPELSFKIFDSLFRLPRMILPSTQAEMDLISTRFNYPLPLFLVGVGIKFEDNWSKKVNLPDKPYILYVGRLSKPKGYFQLLNNFSNFKKKFRSNLKLVLIGQKVEDLPTNQAIKYLGVVSNRLKISLIKNAEFIVNPSFYESLSLLMLEAWSQSKPILVNGKCNVLKSQVIKSNGGLYYENKDEFATMTNWLLKSKKGKMQLGKNGFEYYQNNYSWPIIETKFKILIDNLV